MSAATMTSMTARAEDFNFTTRIPARHAQQAVRDMSATRLLDDELVDVQELVSQPAVERLDQPVVGGLVRARVVELEAASIRPLVQRLGGELLPLSTSIARG